MNYYRRLLSINPTVWLLVGVIAAGVLLVAWLRYSPLVPPSWLTYAVQPAIALTATTIALLGSRGKTDRARHRVDKAIVVGSVLAIWFVLQFVTGIFLTYTRNAMAPSLGVTVINLLAYGTVAIAMELTRHRALLLLGRRNMVWFSGVIAFVFALPFMNLGQVSDISTVEGAVKMIFIDVVPTLASSMVLTYLAIAAGLPAQLTYRVGILAAALLPPIVPKLDWYLIGVSYTLLAITVYATIDYSMQRHANTHGRRKRHVHVASELMAYSVIVALVLFMTGLFAYKPMAVVSNSMQPVFSRGAMVIVQKARPVDISVGDIVQYQAKGRMITHRVIAIDLGGSGAGEAVFITKGDNSPSKDEPVEGQQIIGIVRAAIPYVGYPTVWLREMSI